MTAFNDRPASDLPASSDPPAPSRPPTPSAKRYLLALPALAVLVWAVPALTHHPSPLRQVRRVLQEFREASPNDSGPNRGMNAALVVRGQLLMHRISRVNADQEVMLLGILSGPADDMTQSEALDVLCIAGRMNALSLGQKKDDLKATLEILRRSPGPMVRLESARLLGHLGDADAAPALAALQEDSDPKVQEAAEIALAKVRR